MTSSGHLGDAISALLDGELDVAAASAAESHLAECAECRAEYHAVDRVRSTLRAAPSIEPRRALGSAAVVAFEPRRRRRPRSVLTGASIAATAACWLLLLALTATDNRVTPPVEQVLSQASLLGGTSPQPDLVRAALQFPAAPVTQADGYELATAYLDPSGGLTLVLYGPEGPVIVHEQAGEADWSELGSARLTRIGDIQVALLERGIHQVVVMEQDGVVSTVVGTGDADTLLAVTDAVADLAPERHRSALDKLRSACRGLLESFGLG
jgi:hypothetical protein